ncbi:MAG: hypothetical protein VKL42_23210 [Snowella sp.]|nr:hypothetical protein [Snowella sp.]
MANDRAASHCQCCCCCVEKIWAASSQLASTSLSEIVTYNTDLL